MSTTYEPGLYLAEVINQGFEESSKKHTPAFFLQLKILNRYGTNEELQECQHFERPCRHWLANEVSVNMLKRDLTGLEVEINDLAQLMPDVPNHVSLVGRKLKVNCEWESFNGRQQERWSIDRPRQSKKLNLEAVRALNDRFGHLLRGGTAVKQVAEPVTPNTTDTPF